MGHCAEMEQLQEELRALELGELLQRASREGVTEEVVRAAIFASKLEAWGMCA